MLSNASLDCSPLDHVQQRLSLVNGHLSCAGASTTLESVATQMHGPTRHKGHLSPGAKAGAGVGGAVGALLLLGCILFWLKVRRARSVTSTVSQSQAEQNAKSTTSPDELPTQDMHEKWELPSPHGLSEAVARERHELG